MPRNGSGSYSIPNTYSAGQTISAAIINANFSDIASELTNSVAKDGQTTMTGQFKASNGTAAAPSLTFGSDTDTGFYRSASNEVSLAQGGSQVGPVTAFPSGTVMLFVQTAAPTGWTKSTAHNDKALRVVSGTVASGGSAAFSSVFGARTILQANLPNVSFTGTASSTGSEHTHTIAYGTRTVDGTPSVTAIDVLGSSSSTATTNSTGAHTHSVSVSSGGSGTAMDFDVQYVDVIMAMKD